MFQNTRDDCITSNGPNSNFMTHKNISTEAKLMKSPERKIVSSNEFVSHYSINNCQTVFLTLKNNSSILLASRNKITSKPKFNRI